MTSAQLIIVFQSIVAIAIFLVLVFKLWPAHRCDSFRQNMFALRDQVFDYAAAEKVRFDDPAYKLLRQSVNGYIRYAHRLTFYRLCLTALDWKLSQRAPDLKWLTKWESALKTLRPEAQNDLRQFHSRAMHLVIKQIVTGSPALLSALAVFILWHVGQASWQNLRKHCYRAAVEIVSHFIDPRLLEEDAARMAA